jgi:hypothetical protein
MFWRLAPPLGRAPHRDRDGRPVPYEALAVVGYLAYRKRLFVGI